MSTKCLIILCMIDAMEDREVATMDIQGYFLKTGYKKGDIHINMEVTIVNLLKDIDLDYYKGFISVLES